MSAIHLPLKALFVTALAIASPSCRVPSVCESTPADFAGTYVFHNINDPFSCECAVSDCSDCAYTLERGATCSDTRCEVPQTLGNDITFTILSDGTVTVDGGQADGLWDCQVPKSNLCDFEIRCKEKSGNQKEFGVTFKQIQPQTAA